MFILDAFTMQAPLVQHHTTMKRMGVLTNPRKDHYNSYWDVYSPYYSKILAERYFGQNKEDIREKIHEIITSGISVDGLGLLFEC